MTEIEQIKETIKKCEDVLLAGWLKELLAIKEKTLDACDKNLCKNYNKLFNRCKFINGYCSMKKTNKK